MNETVDSTASGSQHVAWHVVVEGIVGLLLAVAQLVVLRGLSIGVILTFSLPPLFAFMWLRRSPYTPTRVVAAAFLALIALGAIISHMPAVLPNMGGVDRRLPPQADRLLTWYVVVYLSFLCIIIPLRVLIGDLVQRYRGQPARFSTTTCVLGLVTIAVLSGPLPILFGALLGLWPWPAG